jgi:hypothetical protein
MTVEESATMVGEAKYFDKRELTADVLDVAALYAKQLPDTEYFAGLKEKLSAVSDRATAVSLMQKAHRRFERVSGLPKVGDRVQTKNQMFFVEASNPDTGEEIETMFPRGHSLKVIAVDEREDTVTVQLPDGFEAVLYAGDLEQ